MTDYPGDFLIKQSAHTGRVKPMMNNIKIIEGNTYEQKTENEEDETGAGVV